MLLFTSIMNLLLKNGGPRTNYKCNMNEQVLFCLDHQEHGKMIKKHEKENNRRTRKTRFGQSNQPTIQTLKVNM